MALSHPRIFSILDISRMKRQAGYVYDRPNIAFDLPNRQPSTSFTTQATSSSSAQAQQMYYAYPGPGGSNVGKSMTNDQVNIGFSNSRSTTVSTKVTAGSTGYNYEPQGVSRVGLGPENSPIAIIGDTAQSTSSNQGYGYNSPSPTISAQGQTNGQSVSTNAPTYLPPTANPTVNQGTGTVGVGAVNQSGSTTSVGISSAYIPPSAIASATTASAPASTVLQGIPENVLNAMYLPPSINSIVTPQSSTSPPGYLPPSGPSSPSSIQGILSTPAPTYLPPLL